MRTPMILANWKMNPRLDEALTLVNQMRSRSRVTLHSKGADTSPGSVGLTLDAGLDSLSGIEAVICPPSIALYPLKQALRDSSIKLGAQNVHFEARGAYTGEISARMLADVCEYVFIGHVERRRYFGETDQTINKKILASLSVGLKPIVCIGEDRDDYKWEQREVLLSSQVEAYLSGANSTPGLVIVYEPSWAIGSGISVEASDAARAMEFIRERIAVLTSQANADQTHLLIGGSINASNVGGYMGWQQIDGAGVGANSLVPEAFVQIAALISQLKGVL